MTLSVTHPFVSTVTEDATSGVAGGPVGPTEWNAIHTLSGVLEVAKGGTGASITFTQGSVIFAGASGLYSQDNSKLFWDDTNFAFGIGTAVPSTLNGTFASAAGLAIVSNSSTGTSPRLVLKDSNGDGAAFIRAVSGTDSQFGSLNNVPVSIYVNNVQSAQFTSTRGQLALGVDTVAGGNLKLFGATSGNLQIAPQATAGTPIWTAGTSSGTPAVTASAPLAITSATGNITLDLTANYTWTGQHTFNVARTIASATGATLDDINVQAATTTITGNTGSPITELHKVGLYKPTFTDSSAVTITDASTLYIDNAPLAAGSVTITRPWSLRIAAGSSFLSGTNEAGTVTDAGGTARNSTLTVQRNLTSLNATNLNGLLVDYTYNNDQANKTINGLFNVLVVPSSNATAHGSIRGYNASVTFSGSSTASTVVAQLVGAAIGGTGTVTTLQGVAATVTNSGGGTSTASETYRVSTPIGATTGLTSVWTNIYGIRILNQNPSGAGTNTLTNAPIAILIESQTATGAYAIQQNGSGLNSFAGVSSFTSGTAATTTATGSVVITGGLGASGAGWFGGLINSAGASITAASGTAIPANGTAGTGYLFSSTANFGVFFGSSSPTISAAQGSLYLRSDGSSTSTRAYINSNGGNTWVAITTSA